MLIFSCLTVIDPGPSLGGAIVLSIEVLSKPENKLVSNLKTERWQQKFCGP